MSTSFPVSRTKVPPALCQRFGCLRMIALFLAVLAVDFAHGEGWYWRGTAQDTMSAEKDGSGKSLWENQNNPGTYGIPTTSDTAILNNGSTATLRKTDETWLNQLQGVDIHDGASTLIVDVGERQAGEFSSLHIIHPMSRTTIPTFSALATDSGLSRLVRLQPRTTTAATYGRQTGISAG